MGNIANEAEIRKLVTAQMAEGIKGSSNKGFEVIHKPLLDMSKTNSDISKNTHVSNSKLDELNKSILKLTKMFPDALKSQNDDMIKAQRKLAEEQAYNDVKNDKTANAFGDSIAKLGEIITKSNDGIVVGLAKLGDDLSQLRKGFSNIGTVISALGLIGGALSLFSDNQNIKNFGLKTVAKTGARTVGKAVSKVGLKAMEFVGGKIASHKAAKVAANVAGDVAEKAPGKLAKVAGIAGKVASKGAKTALKAIPFIGTAIGLKMAFDKWRKGDKIGAALEIAGAAVDFIPGIGPVLSLGIDLISLGRDLKNEAEGKFQTPPPPLMSPTTIENLKNLPVIGSVLHMKDAFSLWKTGDKKGAIQAMGQGLMSLTPLGAMFGIIDAIRERTSGVKDPEQLKEMKAKNFSTLLHTMPGIGVVMNMKDAIDHWKKGKKGEALKSFAKGFVMLNPFGQAFTVAAAVFEKFTGRDMMGELGQTIKGVDTGLSDQLMGTITGILDKVFNFFSKVGGGVAKIAGVAGDFVKSIFGDTTQGGGETAPGDGPATSKPGAGGNIAKYREAMRQSESSGNYSAGPNKYGYLGAYQFGEAAYKDSGIANDKRFFVDGKPLTWSQIKKNPKLFTPAMQDQAFDNYTLRNLKTIRSKYSKYYGKTINGHVITESGLAATAHLLGLGGVAKFMAGEDVMDGKEGDKKRTHAYEYSDKFANFETNTLVASGETAKQNIRFDGEISTAKSSTPAVKIDTAEPETTIVTRKPDAVKTDVKAAPKTSMPVTKTAQAQPDAIQTMALNSQTIEAIGKVMARSMLEIIKSEPDKYPGFSSNARA